MKKWLATAVVLAGITVGAGVGKLSFVAVTGPWIADGDMDIGVWTTLNSIGEKNLSQYWRARSAIYGPFGLPPTEVVYFQAAKDDSGKDLETRCTYAMHGGKAPARWWSIAVYRDSFYIDNPEDRYSITQSTIKTRDDGQWTIRLSPSGEGENGLALGHKPGRVQLTYRLYHPDAGVAQNRNDVALPSIELISCPDSSSS